MRLFALVAVFLMSFAVSAPAALLELAVFDNGILQGTATATDGTALLTITTDPAFNALSIAAAGSPFLPGGDLSSVTLDVTSANITSTHILTVDIIQTGLNLPPGSIASTFTINNLVGTPGDSVLSTFADGVSIASLGSTLDSHTFGVGSIVGTFGPVTSFLPTLTSDAEQYKITFFAPGQSANDTIQLSSVVPEPQTWALLIIGGMFLGGRYFGRGRIPRPPRFI